MSSIIQNGMQFALPIPSFRSAHFGDTPLGANILGAVTYTSQPGEPHLDNCYPELPVHMVGDSAERFKEIWYTDREVAHGELDGVVYAYDGEYFFCGGHVKEDGSYTDAVRSAYVTALGLIRTLDYNRIFRMWNFIADINAGNSAGLEVYRDFCRGRAQAFEQLAVPSDQLPAATGIGSLGGGIAFCLLASRSARCINIENSRQVPAYQYPERYGPRSPSFARATYVAPADDNQSGHIYVSGTSSVVGHMTMHHGDVATQCHETLANIAHLLSADNLARHGVRSGRDLTDLRNVKAYVRHRRDIATVREICTKAMDPTVDIAFLNVDVCRSDLLVEIEGVLLA